MGVNRPRHQLLAGPRFTEDVNGRVGRRDLLDGREHRAHGGRFADDVVEVIVGGGVRAQRRALGLGPLARPPFAAQLESPRHLEPHHLGRERLLQELPGPEPHRLDRRLDRAERRHDHHRAVGIAFPYRLDDVQAADPVHLEIGDHELHGGTARRGGLRQPLGAGRRRDRLVAHAADGGGEPLAHRFVVVDDQDASHAVRLSLRVRF